VKATAELPAAAASDDSLEHNSSGRHLHGGSELAMKLQIVSSHVALAGRIAQCSEQLEAGFGEPDIGSSNSTLAIAEASTAAAAAAAAVSDPAAGRRRTAVVETSVGTVVFVGKVAFAVTEFGSSVAELAGRIVGCNCKPVATGPVGFGFGFAGVADYAVQVGSRRKARPWVAAGSTSAVGRRPNIARSHLVEMPRMEAAFSCSSIQCGLSLFPCDISPPAVYGQPHLRLLDVDSSASRSRTATCGAGSLGRTSKSSI
jgi:hypothetical protein